MIVEDAHKIEDGPASAGDSSRMSADATRQIEASWYKHLKQRGHTEISGQSRVRLDSRDRSISHRQDRFFVESEQLYSRCLSSELSSDHAASMCLSTPIGSICRLCAGTYAAECAPLRALFRPSSNYHQNRTGQFLLRGRRALRHSPRWLYLVRYRQ